jgi:rRNA processing protein Gar1
VLHLSKSGNLILRLESAWIPPEGAQVCDYKIARIGIVNNILGPVKAPYVSIQPSVDDAGVLSGRVLYLLDGN